MKKIEILAPAGSLLGLKAAISASCDAVYIGGSHFGARAYADNLSEEELKYAIDYAHLYGKKIYLTVNTLLKEEELSDLYTYIKPYYEVGVDAVIVQDLGVARLLHTNFPDLALHASTQMSLTMAQGANLLKSYGFTRFVPARELSLAEIQNMRRDTNLEIECFVHGALCYCYSGQCLLSSTIGGRSGNRGRCAQPCRMPYRMEGEHQASYLLSPKDINTLSLIPELVEAGIDSFKIEGRMKKPAYAALTSYLYRKYTDLYLDKGREGFARFQRDHKREWEADHMALRDLYNRGGTSSGYYHQHNGSTMMAMKRPNHYGVLVGTVKEVSKTQVMVNLSESINPQDVLEFRNDKEDPLYEYTAGKASINGECILVNYKHGANIKKGDRLFRTRNQVLLEQLQTTYVEHEEKLAVVGDVEVVTGKPFSITLSHQACQITVVGEIVQAAQKQPLTKEKVRAAIDKINDTLFSFSDLRLTMTEDAFLPMSAVKTLRREAINALYEKLTDLYHHRLPAQNAINSLKMEAGLEQKANQESIKIDVLVHTMEQLEAALLLPFISRIYVSLERLLSEPTLLEWENIKAAFQKEKKELYLVLPYIFRNETFAFYKKRSYLPVDGYLVRNMEEAAFLKEKEAPGNWIADANFYSYNKEAKGFFAALSLKETTIPLELSREEIRKRGVVRDTLIVYGSMPLMISAQCIQKNTTGCTKCASEHVFTDRKGKEYYVYNSCKNCYNIIYNAKVLSLLEEAEDIRELNIPRIRLDFVRESKEEMVSILTKYQDAFLEQRKVDSINNSTKGNYRRSIE